MECVLLLWWCYQKFVASSVPRPSLFYLGSKNYILMAVSHSFKIFHRTTRKCIFYTLCDFTFTVEISEKKNLLPRQVHLIFHVNKRANPTLSFVGKIRKWSEKVLKDIFESFYQRLAQKRIFSPLSRLVYNWYANTILSFLVKIKKIALWIELNSLKIFFGW